MGVSQNKRIKSISFNVKNEDDRAILKHVSRRNFSGYVKKLILTDMRRKEAEKAKNPSKLTSSTSNSKIAKIYPPNTFSKPFTSSPPSTPIKNQGI